MSYVDETIERVVAQNPSQPEFHQAVKEVLESLRVVIEANEEAYRRDALLERLTTQGTGSGKQRIPRTVQQRHRSVQGRSSLPSFCNLKHYQIPGL